jgi:hypothetical protein
MDAVGLRRFFDMTKIATNISTTVTTGGQGNQGIVAGPDGKGCHRPGEGSIDIKPQNPHTDHVYLPRCPGPGRPPWPPWGPGPIKLKPRYEDKSAGDAIEELRRQPTPISGEALEKAILKGTGDLDNQAAGAEYRDFKGYVEQNWDKLSPDAKAKWRVYQQTALKAQARGGTGIPVGEWHAMASKMKRTRGCHDFSYRDASARDALSKLENQPGAITAGDFLRAFRAGTADLDGQVFGREFSDFARFADKNWHRMTPGARAAFQAYQHTAADARWFGKTGANAFEYGALHAQMRAAADWAQDACLWLQPLRI